MKSFSQLQQYFVNATQNSSANNILWGNQLINDEHRYLLQKYFNNETIYSIPTQGAASQIITTTPGGISAGATQANLTSNWTGTTGTVQVTFSDGETTIANFTNGSTAISWTTGLVNNVSSTISVGVLTLTASVSAGATSATLTTPWTGNTIAIQVTFSDGEVRLVSFTNGLSPAVITWQVPLAYSATNQISAGGQQFYCLPPNYSKLKNVTITQGNLQWPMQEILTRQEWDRLNVFPYYANIPVYFYIYPGGDHGGQVGIWPIPSTTDNVMNFSYKYRVPDLSIPDATGTATVNVSTSPTTVTATGLALTVNKQLEARWIQFPQPDGDNLWYQISNISNIGSTTTATLYQPYQGISLTGKAYTIGQMPLISEDFQDLLVYRPLMIYFSSINKDVDKASQFKDLYEEKLAQLADYSGTNTTNINLGRRPTNSNPNLYQGSFGGN
jgi:hypothetical protein